MDGVIDVEEGFSKYSDDDPNDLSIDRKHRIISNIIRNFNNRLKKDKDGSAFYAVLPDEFRAYCKILKLNERELKSALRHAGYLYIDMGRSYNEYTRNCRIDGKQQRCICLYLERRINESTGKCYGDSFYDDSLG